MYLTQENYYRAYEHIKNNASQARPGQCTVVLLVAFPDADALCCCRILATLFTNDYIAHKVIPVAGFDDITTENELLIADNDELRSIILINCGGMVNLVELLTLGPDMSVFVIDSHRPLKLDNLFNSQQICILDDGDVEELREERDAFNEIGFESSEDEDGTSSDDDASEFPDGNDEHQESQDLSDSDLPADNNVDANDTANDDPGETATLPSEDGSATTPVWSEKSQNELEEDVDAQSILSADGARKASQKDGKKERRRKLAICKQVLIDYYSSGWFGGSAAGIAYQLASQVAKANNDMLWLAIIGLTDQLVYEKVQNEAYNLQVDVLKDEVHRFNVEEAKDSETFEPSSSGPDDTRIMYKEKEFRFMLFRHWSLYESMFHSTYIASKLGIWREKGRQKLQNLLARMGFSLAEANQPYIHMNVDLRKDIYVRLEDSAVTYGLADLTYRSFHRNHGYKCILSATDVIYSLTALLEAPPEIASKLGVELELGGYTLEEKNAFGTDIFGSLTGFYLAYDALQNISLLHSGIALSQSLQRAIVRTGTMIIDDCLVRTLRTYRLAILKENPNLNIFLHPLTLTKLGHFLLTAMRETGKSYLPFVIGVLNPTTDAYLLVGLESAQETKMQSKFASAFERTASVTKARVKHDRFDTCVIELAKEDLTKFMETLQIYT